jgi:hypothetical protein
MARLIDELKKLPGVGTKSAQRFAFHSCAPRDEDAAALADAVRALKASLRLCSICNNVTDVDPCAYCTSPVRNQRLICVVEEPTSIASPSSAPAATRASTTSSTARSPLSTASAPTSSAPPTSSPASSAAKSTKSSSPPAPPSKAKPQQAGWPQPSAASQARPCHQDHQNRHRRPSRQRHRIRRRSHHVPSHGRPPRGRAPPLLFF